MLGELIAEIGLRFVFEILLYGLTYWTGYVLLKILTFGRIQVAPFSTVGEKNKGRKFDRSFFLNRYGRRMLKMEMVCLVGIAFWVLIGICIYFEMRPDSKPATAGSIKTSTPHQTR